jgi:CheY-like chemotaxis protein
MSSRTVLCVDPDADERARTVDALEAAGFDVAAASGLADAPALEGFDAVVTEHDLPGGTGLDLLSSVREAAPDATCVVFTDADLGTIDTSRVPELVVESVSKAGSDARDRLVGLLSFSMAQPTQTSYPLPQSESDRLSALGAYDLDDEATAAALDRVTSLAKESFGVPMASINIIESDTQRTVACAGGELGPLDREESVCTFTILEREPLVVADLLEDPRFESVDAIRDTGIRAYAGAPLRVPDFDGPDGPAGANGSTAPTDRDVPIGSLCLYDFEPRSFDDDTVARLEQFAAEIVDQIVLRHRLSVADSVSVPPTTTDTGSGPASTLSTDPAAEDDESESPPSDSPVGGDGGVSQ